VEYQDIIEERWTANFGDRLNEIVFIGIDINEIEIGNNSKSAFAMPMKL
jgi:hypothetical protein